VLDKKAAIQKGGTPRRKGLCKIWKKKKPLRERSTGQEQSPGPEGCGRTVILLSAEIG